MQFSKSAGKHWTELSGSLSLSLLSSFIFLRRALYPPSPFTSLDLPLATLYPPPSTNSLSGRRRHSLRISDGGSGIHAPISTFFFDEI